MTTDAARPTSDLLEGDTPAMRLFSLLELIAGRDAFVSLQDLVEETGLPKPTMHRMLQQLEGADLLVRQSDGRHYGTAARLRKFAESLLLNATQHGARHAVLRALVDEVGETCNVTALSGNEVLYLDRVETSEPLRFSLHSGARVPVHCTASGKMILAHMSPAQRHKLLAHARLSAPTSKSITDLEVLDRELQSVRRDGYAIDDEEFLAGLVCLAVPVPTEVGRSNTCVAVQAPVVRLAPDQAVGLLPALHRAALAISEIEAEGARA